MVPVEEEGDSDRFGEEDWRGRDEKMSKRRRGGGVGGVKTNGGAKKGRLKG